MQSRKEAIEQTGHIKDVKHHAAVQTDPTEKQKMAGSIATQGTDAKGKLVGGNGISRAPQTGLNKD